MKVSGIRLRDFALGTVIGLVPGVVAIALLADRIAASLQRPDMGSFAALAASVAAVGLGPVFFRRWLRRKRAEKSSG